MRGRRKLIEPQFEVGDQLPGNQEYKIQDKQLRMTGRAEELASGSVGVLYRADYKGMQRVIKFLSPESGGDQQARLPLETLERAFENEIRILSTLTHTHIVKIADFGKSMVKGKTYSYYVMEYVGGESFDEYWEKCSARDFLHILDELLDALDFGGGPYYLDRDRAKLRESPAVISDATSGSDDTTSCSCKHLLCCPSSNTWRGVW